MWTLWKNTLLMLHSSYDVVTYKYLTSVDVYLKRIHKKTSQYPFIFVLYDVRIEIIFLTGELLPINMCCQAIFIHSGFLLYINILWSALQQHVLISNNSWVRKNYFINVTNYMYLFFRTLRILIQSFIRGILDNTFGLYTMASLLWDHLIWKYKINERKRWILWDKISYFCITIQVSSVTPFLPAHPY